MSAGRVALPGKPRKYRARYDGAPPFSPANDDAVHARYRAAVMVKIALRPGNNDDMLEALGLIAMVRAEKPANSGRWPKAMASGLALAGIIVLFIPTSMVLGI